MEFFSLIDIYILIFLFLCLFKKYELLQAHRKVKEQNKTNYVMQWLKTWPQETKCMGSNPVQPLFAV